jgi:hypothetical protein
MVDAVDSKSTDFGREGSSPFVPTKETGYSTAW